MFGTAKNQKHTHMDGVRLQICSTINNWIYSFCQKGAVKSANTLSFQKMHNALDQYHQCTQQLPLIIQSAHFL